MKEFKPSEYQQSIFDFVEHGVGNAVISAAAGSGKTSTCVASLKLIPKTKKCLFIAFNNSIVDELAERLKGNKNVTVKTIHSLGYLMVRRNLGSDIEIDEYKYKTYVRNNINELSSADGNMFLNRAEVDEYINSIVSLIDMSRFNLAQTVDDIEQVAVKYSIPLMADECEVALKCLEWGKEHYETIDFTDMIWFPYELSLKPTGLKYDWIFIDECQDLSLLSIEVFLKCFKQGTRFCAVGDRNQAIYGFSGADKDAFNAMCNHPNTKLFPLPISYRCANRIVKFANKLVPDMKPREDAPEGQLLFKCNLNILSDGDMVLSRTNANLVKLYTRLLKMNVNCYIKGKDIGKNLIGLLESIDQDNFDAQLNTDSVNVRLYERILDSRNNLVVNNGLTLADATLAQSTMALYDSVTALFILSSTCRDKNELISKINEIFKDEADGICLSTIHKAKGLEADRVFILCGSTLWHDEEDDDGNSDADSLSWIELQERNLSYVAYTRAKNTLGFISEEEFRPIGSFNDPASIINELRVIENKIAPITGKEPLQTADNVELAKFNLRSATVIKNELEDGNTIEISSANEIKTDNQLLEELSLFS